MDILEIIKNNQPLFLKRPDISDTVWQRFIDFVGPAAKGLYICTSGTNSKKLTILNISHQKMLKHAEAFGKLFNIKPGEVWFQSLPSFYMGGVSLFYRVHALKGSIRLNDDYSMQSIINSCEGCNHLSLVPRQIYDLEKLTMPSSIKMVLVGGDRLSKSLEKKLDEKIFYKTYGLSESCGQIATSRVGSKGVELLPFVTVTDINPLSFSTPYHYDYLFTQEQDSFVIEEYPGFVKTQDSGVVNDRKLILEGRLGRKIKINARFYNLDEVEDELSSKTSIGLFVSSEPSEKYGAQIVVYSLLPIDKQLLKSLHIQKNYLIDELLYTQSGKMIKNKGRYKPSKTMEID